MRIHNFAVRFVLTWTVLSIIFNPSLALLQYTAAEVLQLRFHRYDPLLLQNLSPDITLPPPRKYIYRGFRRSYHIDDSTAIKLVHNSTSSKKLW